MMNIVEVTLSDLPCYARIPMRLEVHAVLEPEPIDGGLGGIRLIERAVDAPWTKDYDADGSPPTSWPREFDIQSWGLFLACDDDSGLELGGAAVAFNTNGVNMLEGRSDLGVLWDIRVHPRAMRQGVGRALFDHTKAWLRERGATTLKIETQNVNIPACRFYRAQGCTLGSIRRDAYGPELTHELQLLWYLAL